MSNTVNAEFSKKLAPTPAGLEVSVDKRDVVAPTAAPTANDTQELCVLPAGTVPVDFQLFVPDLDTGATVTFSLGFLNTGKTDLSTAAAEGAAVLASAQTTAQGGGQLRNVAEALFKVTPVAYDRYFAVKYTGTFAGWQAGTFRAALSYRNAA